MKVIKKHWKQILLYTIILIGLTIMLALSSPSFKTAPVPRGDFEVETQIEDMPSISEAPEHPGEQYKRPSYVG